MIFYLGFFVGWVIGIFSAVMLIYLVRKETESVADGKRIEGGWSLRHPRGERVKIYCWAEIPEAPMPDEFCQKPTVTRKKKDS